MSLSVIRTAYCDLQPYCHVFSRWLILFHLTCYFQCFSFFAGDVILLRLRSGICHYRCSSNTFLAFEYFFLIKLSRYSENTKPIACITCQLIVAWFYHEFWSFFGMYIEMHFVHLIKKSLLDVYQSSFFSKCVRIKVSQKENKRFRSIWDSAKIMCLTLYEYTFFDSLINTGLGYIIYFYNFCHRTE